MRAMGKPSGGVAMGLTDERIRQIEERHAEVMKRTDDYNASAVNFWYATDALEMMDEIGRLRFLLASMIRTYEDEAGDTEALVEAKAHLAEVWGEWHTTKKRTLEPAPSQQPDTDISGGDGVE
jgi:hypothetical protein